MLETESDNIAIYQHILTVIEEGDLELFKVLFEHLDYEDSELAYTAIMHNRLEILKLVEAKIGSEIYCLELAAKHGHCEILSHLLSHHSLASKWLLGAADIALENQKYDALKIILDATMKQSKKEYEVLSCLHALETITSP